MSNLSSGWSTFVSGLLLVTAPDRPLYQRLGEGALRGNNSARANPQFYVYKYVSDYQRTSILCA